MLSRFYISFFTADRFIQPQSFTFHLVLWNCPPTPPVMCRELSVVLASRVELSREQATGGLLQVGSSVSTVFFAFE